MKQYFKIISIVAILAAFMQITATAQRMETISAKVGDKIKLDVPEEYVLMTSWAWEWSAEPSEAVRLEQSNIFHCYVTLKPEAQNHDYIEVYFYFETSVNAQKVPYQLWWRIKVENNTNPSPDPNPGSDPNPGPEVDNWSSEGNYDISWYNNSQTYFNISNNKELAGVAYLVKNKQTDFKDKTIYLNGNIDLSGKYWYPIGSSEDYPFKGTFDGRNYTIKGLSICSLFENQRYFGLFGRAVDATIKNLNLVGKIDIETPVEYRKTFDGGYYNVILYIGGLAGYMSGDVEYCKCEMPVHYSTNVEKTKTECDAYIGGLIGDATGNISYCSHIGDFNCEITNPGSIGLSAPCIGGITGRSHAIIEYCENTSNSISITIPYNENRAWDVTIGGIVGISLWGNLVDFYPKISFCKNVIKEINVPYGGFKWFDQVSCGCYIGGILGKDIWDARLYQGLYYDNPFTKIENCYSSTKVVKVSGSNALRKMYYGGISIHNYDRYKNNFSNSDASVQCPVSIVYGDSGSKSFSSSQMQTSSFLNELNKNITQETENPVWIQDTGGGYPYFSSVQDCSYFTAKTVEGVDVQFYVYKISSGECMVNSAIDQSTSGSITIPETVQGLKVTEIGYSAFENCTGITSVNIPATMKDIDDSAFSGCTGLTSVSFVEGVTDVTVGMFAFSRCTSLNSVSFADGVKELGFSAFSGCTSLTTLTGLSNIEKIGSYCFENNCPWYNSLPDGLVYLGKVLYKYKGTMPDNTTVNVLEGTTQIAKECFYKCSGLVGITIPQSVKSIENYVFQDCENLSSITVASGNVIFDSRDNCNAIVETAKNTIIAGCKNTTFPSTVTAIGTYAFYRSGIEEIVIPNNIDSIASSAFGYSKSLTSVMIGKGTRVIGTGAFSGCRELNNLSVTNDNPYYDSRDNCNAIIEKTTDRLVVGCSTTVIPSTVKCIGEESFYGNKRIESLTIPDEVEKIEQSAFGYNDSLRSLTIGSKVKEIGKYAFGGCYALKNIYSLVKEPLEINDRVFLTEFNRNDSIYNNATLYVPIGSKAIYQSTAGWNKFKNIVEGEPTIEPDQTLKGDVNGDGSVNGTDLVALTNIILGKNDRTAAADVNGDGQVNGTDYVSLVNIILGRSNARSMAKVMTRAAGATSLSIEPFDIKAGETQELVIDLTNPSDEITLVQFDLRLPAGLSLKQTNGEYDIDIADRTTWRKHSLDANAQEDGTIRFLLASNSNTVLSGTEGAIIKMTLVADNSFNSGDIKLENILMVTPDEKEVTQDTYIYTIGGTPVPDPVHDTTKLSFEDFAITPGGEAEVMIDLTNPDDEITLVQFDLRLPAGLSLKKADGEYDIDIAGRTTWRKHSLDASAQADGSIRFLLASSSNATLSGTEGAVIKMTLVAENSFISGDIKLENILMVTPEEKEVTQDVYTYTIDNSTPVNPPVPGTATLAIEVFPVRAGSEAEMVIDLTNPDDEITLVQFDLRLPAGLSLKQTSEGYDIDIAGRTTWRKHSLDANAQTEGTVRFLLASSSNATLSGTSGAIIKMTLVADNSFESGTVKLENILLVTPDEQERKPAEAEVVVSGIADILMDSDKAMPVYSLSGQRLAAPRKGINIVGGKKVVIK